MVNVRWSNAPNPRRLVPVLSAKVGRPVTALVAAPAVGVLVHWSAEQKRSVPCCDGCPYDVVQKPRWKGYIAAYRHNGQRVVVEVTEGAVAAHPSLLTAECVGYRWEFMRSGSKDNSPLIARLLTQYERQSNVPAFDVRDILLAIWNVCD